MAASQILIYDNSSIMTELFIDIGECQLASSFYESRSALKPVEKLLSEAAVAIGHNERPLPENDLPEGVGAAGGIGAGVAAGTGILIAGVGEGVAGAAALAQGLAVAGSIVGGGMAAGIAVVAAPAVVLGLAGMWAVRWRNEKMNLPQTKELLLQEALWMIDALVRERQSTDTSNKERIDYLSRLVTLLQAAVDNLWSDLKAA